MFKQPHHKRFDYRPMYYKPEKDPDTKRRQRIKFPRQTKVTNPFSQTVIIVILIIMLALYILKKLAIDN
ncbi:hypothetical protein K1X84_07805 [bacterium]|nr:hypothetical protein [bacterium]